MPTSIGRDETRHLADEEDAQVVEMLARPEYEWAHLAGAIYVPLETQFRDLARDRLDPNRPQVNWLRLPTPPISPHTESVAESSEASGNRH